MNNKYTDYANGVVNGKIIACKYIKLACQRYLDWFKRDDIEFRSEKADDVVNFCQRLKHFSGRFNGKNFILEDFQKWICYNIFGFYYKGTDDRVIKNVYLELARKNGKTFFAAAICLYVFIKDGGFASEVELIANSKKQASICFDMCSNMIQKLDPKHKFFKTYRDKIKFDKTKSFLQVLSSDSGNNDGWGSQLFVADEAHAYPDSKMYDVMKSSQGAKDSPLAIIITTAGFNLFSFCYQMRQTNIDVLYGVKQDDSQFTAIYTLDEDDDWQDEKNWIKANPNLNVTVKPQYLREQIQQAKNNSSLEVSIRTKNFNQWLATSDVWIGNDLLLECSKPININDYSDCIGYIGVDLAAVSDLTAVSLMIPTEDKFLFKTWYYLPQSALSNNSNAELYKKWQRLGLLTITNGNVTDYDAITTDIMKIGELVNIQSIAYDTWNSTSWAIQMTELNQPLEPYSQSLGNFNRPTKEIERLIKSDKVIIDDNEITRYCFGNVVLKQDWNDNVKPTKADPLQKIDGVIAMIEALGIYLTKIHYDNII